MTNLVSCSSPSGPHIWPEVRIAAGIEASTITSLGTCRLVIPLSEFTIARRGPRAYAASSAPSMSRRTPSGAPASFARRSARPSLGFAPMDRTASACPSKISGKNTSTACPKMIGSDTFIIVALRWSEKSTSRSRASVICSARK